MARLWCMRWIPCHLASRFDHGIGSGKDWLKIRSLTRWTKNRPFAHDFTRSPSRNSEVERSFCSFVLGLVVDWTWSDESGLLRSIYIIPVLESEVLVQVANLVHCDMLWSWQHDERRRHLYILTKNRTKRSCFNRQVALGLICFDRDYSRSCQYIWHC